MSFLVQAVDLRPSDHGGGPYGDPYLEPTIAAANERGYELANALGKQLPPRAVEHLRVHVLGVDGPGIQLMTVIRV